MLSQLLWWHAQYNLCWCTSLFAHGAWSCNLQLSTWSVTIATKRAHVSCRNGHDRVHSGINVILNWLDILDSHARLWMTKKPHTIVKVLLQNFVHHFVYMYFIYSIYLHVFLIFWKHTLLDYCWTEYITTSLLLSPPLSHQPNLPQSSHLVLQWSVYPPPSCIREWPNWILPPSPSPLQLLAQWQLGSSNPRHLRPDWSEAVRTILSGRWRNWIHLKQREKEQKKMIYR